MMIEVENLTKHYVGRTAVDGLTFGIESGEIVGFLGPNGAGKSTTMRILAGYMPPSSGTARVNSFDVFYQSIEARRSIGYMPENAPLYLDMRVREYLRFRGLLKGLGGKRLRTRLNEVMEACGLTDVRRKIIATLSKGYRQRVALADALISSPPLLILDEPTNGLDPTQIRHVRELLKGLGREHTVLLSTHILREVELSCDRVLLLHKGKLRADDTPGNLVRKIRAASEVIMEIKDKDHVTDHLQRITGVRKISEELLDGGWRRVTLRVEAKGDVREPIMELALKNQWQIRELHRELPSLEDVFVELTSTD
jgi:ABC-2 type transport system ATP-binding protein